MQWVADEWLSGVTGLRCYNLHYNPAEVESGSVLPAADSEGFYAAKVAPAQIRLANSLQAGGFRLVDTNLTLSRSSTDAGQRGAARLADSKDEARVREIANTAFRWSRFHNDQAFSRDTANNIKAEWAGNFFAGGRGDCLIVVERDKEIAGFLLVVLKGSVAIIDLIGVDEKYRGQGCGREMINFLMNHFASDCPEIHVGTQLANSGSLAFYQSMGFRLISSSHNFHKHTGGIA